MQTNRERLALALRSLTLGVFGFTVATLSLAPGDQPVDRPQPVSHAATLVKAHDCWTGEPPPGRRDVMPGHVVVTVHGRTRYAGERMAGMALDQLFGGADHGLVVHGFCR